MSEPDTTASARSAWGPLIPVAAFFAFMIGALIFTTAGNSARFNDDWLHASADHVRTQMNGSPAEQITRAAIPPRLDLGVYRGWTIHEGDQWAMCLNTGEVDDDNETRHLIFTATSTYNVHDGACPTTRTFTPTGATS